MIEKEYVHYSNTHRKISKQRIVIEACLRAATVRSVCSQPNAEAATSAEQSAARRRRRSAVAADRSYVLVGNAAVLLAHVADRVRLCFGWLARRNGRHTKSVQERLCDRLAHVVLNEELLKAVPLARICIQCILLVVVLVECIVTVHVRQWVCITREKSFREPARVSGLGFRVASGGLCGGGRPVRRRRLEAAELLIGGSERGGSERRPKQRVERRGAVREAQCARHSWQRSSRDISSALERSRRLDVQLSSASASCVRSSKFPLLRLASDCAMIDPMREDE